VVAVVAWMLTSAERRWNDGRFRMHDDDGTGWVMLLLMLVLVAAVVVAVVVLLRNGAAAPARGQARGVDGARGVLQERFARGEIDEDDFRARMRALEETSG
jgi:putative membrane protein